MEAIIIAMLSNAVVRTFLEGIALRIVAEFLHRRATDPAFLSHSDLSFSALALAKTDEEKQNALAQLQKLMSSS